MSLSLIIGGPLDGEMRDFPNDPDSIDLNLSEGGHVITGPVSTKPAAKYVYAKVTFQLPMTHYIFYIPADVEEKERLDYVIQSLSMKYQLSNNKHGALKP